MENLFSFYEDNQAVIEMWSLSTSDIRVLEFLTTDACSKYAIS